MQHLLDAMDNVTPDEVLSQPMALTDLLARGLAPVKFAEQLAGANLSALGEENGSICPVAVGECFCRLTGEAVCEVFSDAAFESLVLSRLG